MVSTTSHINKIRDLLVANIVSALSWLTAFAIRDLVEAGIRAYVPMRDQPRHRLFFYIVYLFLILAIVALIGVFLVG